MKLFQIAELTPQSAGTVRIPIQGAALCAGFPSPADDFLEGSLELPRWLAPNPPATFAWNISGDSMRGAGIFDRDLAVADRSLIVGDTGAIYFMTKSALHSFTRGLARELGSRDITVNLVQPGSTDTDMNPANGEFSDFQRSLSPLGRYGTPEDVATAVTFLASPLARHVTGAILNVDGGQTT